MLNTLSISEYLTAYKFLVKIYGTLELFLLTFFRI